MGTSASELISKNNIYLMAFADNDPKKHTKNGIPVVSFQEAANMHPDAILISVLDKQRSHDMKTLFESYGYSGEFIFLKDIYTTCDLRSGALRRFAPRIKNIPGAVAELGVYKGDFALILNQCFPDKILYLFDTFEGFNDDDIQIENKNNFSCSSKGEFADTSVATVLSRFADSSNIVIQKGIFPDTAKGLEQEIFAFVSLDADLYAPTLAGLEFFYQRLSPGGAILLHDYGSKRFAGVMQAVSDYEKKHGRLVLMPLCDLHKSCIIIHP